MDFLKTLGVALVLCISLLLSGLACVLVAMSMKQQPRGVSDAEVVVAGIGNSGNSIAGGPSVRRLARQVVERDAAPPVEDSSLRAVADALVARARQGDVEAAAFVFELAAAQRERAKTVAATAAPGH